MSNKETENNNVVDIATKRELKEFIRNENKSYVINLTKEEFNAIIQLLYVFNDVNVKEVCRESGNMTKSVEQAIDAFFVKVISYIPRIEED